jgi:4-(gamma-glutamylamino)butanal dehydrogenase
LYKYSIFLSIDVARKAFTNGIWSQRSPQERKQVLLKLADLIDKHQFELALLETLNMGKPIKNSFFDDIPSAAKCIRWYAEAMDKIYDQIAPTAYNSIALITHEPIGVVGAVTAWNYPLYLACANLRQH